MRAKNMSGYEKNRRNKGNQVFIVLSVWLMVLIISCITMTVRAKEVKKTGGYDEVYYDALEEQYKQGIVDLLSEYGLRHSGINLTKMTFSDGCRQYQLRIYNGRFEHMGINTISEIQNRLYEISFPQESCDVEIILGNIYNS